MIDSVCTAAIRKGVWICEQHNLPLVDRKTFDAMGKQMENPPVGDHICPISGKSFGLVDERIGDVEE